MWIYVRYSEILRDNEECLVFDPRDSGKRIKRKVRRRLEADDYDISMTRHGKIVVRSPCYTLLHLQLMTIFRTVYGFARS